MSVEQIATWIGGTLLVYLGLGLLFAVPFVLRGVDREGRVELLLLVSAEGEPVNRELLHLVAEPVEITGEVIRSADTLVLRADPSTYRRVGS